MRLDIEYYTKTYKMSKPIVLHLGDAIKYNHDFYNNEFLARFEVIRNNTTTREEFMDALKEKRLAYPNNHQIPSTVEPARF